jgi:predicted Zn-dependent protease
MPGRQCARRSKRPDLPYTFTGVDATQVDEIATTGGFVRISRDVRPYPANATAAAAVPGHEIGRITARPLARHGTRGRSRLAPGSRRRSWRAGPRPTPGHSLSV